MRAKRRFFDRDSLCARTFTPVWYGSCNDRAALMAMSTHESETLVEHARRLARESKHVIARYRAALPALHQMVEETRQQCQAAKAQLRRWQSAVR